MIGYTTFGNGPHKVLALHGWFGDQDCFAPMYPAIDQDAFTFAFMAYRGYGLSKEIAGEYTMDEIGADALSLANHLGWEKFHVMGHSMGGMAAQWLAVHAPQRVQSVVAINPVPASGVPFDEAGWALFSGAADNPDNRAAIIGFTTGSRHHPAWLKSMVAASLANSKRDAFAAYLIAWVKTNFADQVQGLQTPMLVLPGEHDPALGVDVMKATLMQWYPNAELSVIANAGHYPMNETPVNLATLTQEFLLKHA